MISQHWLTKMQSITRPALIVTCLLLLLSLGQRVFFNHDLTANARHTLLPQSVDTLALFDRHIDVEVFINPIDPQRQAISSLLEQYRQHKADFTIRFTDPAIDPARMRELDIAPGGELFFSADKRVQRISQVSETAITLALQRLARDTPPLAVFVNGHGERSISGNSNADISILAAQLQASGFSTQSTRLTEVDTIDTKGGLLVIASPMSRFLPTEVAMLLDYITRGGNLLWLTEPDSDDGLRALELELGVMRVPGVVVDLATRNLDVERPDFAIANSYSKHLATRGFNSVTLFPQAAAIQLQANREWRAAALVQAGEQAWTETGSISGQVSFGDDKREVAGPFPLIMALERQQAGNTQKVLVSGDGDFIADAWIANGGNRDLGNRLFNWAVSDTALLSVSAPVARDNRLELSPRSTIAMVIAALLLIPASLFGMAGKVWYARRYG